MMYPLFLLAATPVFGLSLHLDLPAPLTVPDMLQVEGALDAATSEADSAGAVDGAAPFEADAASPGENPDLSPAAAAAAPASSVASAMARRAHVARIHRGFGLATWGAMTVTEILGLFQYLNLYGFFGGQGSTLCVTGHAIGGQGTCTGEPWPHAVASGVTTALYYTTFGLSYRMPDPIGLDEGDSASARTLRRHKRLRWAHFGGMAAQIVLGIVSANDRVFGIDRANNFRGADALATVHLLTGIATYTTLTYSGVIMMRHH